MAVPALARQDADDSAPLEHAPSPRSWGRAFGDIRKAVDQRELWGHLGWQDIKQRYRRSVIGPLWITISMAVTAAALGGLYSQLFGQPIGTFMPYVTVGFMIWYFISACVLEGTETFIANEGLIRFLPAPLMIYVFRTVWRQILFFAHNVVVYVIVLAIFFRQLDQPYRMVKQTRTDGQPGILHPGLSWWALLAIPAFVLIVVNGLWVTLLFGIISARFRDIPPVVGSFMQLFFTMTPIIWTTDLLTGGAPGSTEGDHRASREAEPLLPLHRDLPSAAGRSGAELDALGRRRRHHRRRVVARADRAAQLPLPRRLLGVSS